MKRIFIIGNAPDQESISDIFSKQDIVVRFNHPTDECLERYGSRTDILFTINTWKFILKRIEADLIYQSWLQDCKQIILAYHPNILLKYHHQPSLFSRVFTHKKIDGSMNALSYFGLKFPVTFLSEQFYLDCCSLLEIPESEFKNAIPSTGFLAINYFLKNFPDYEIYIHGFSWEGWHGHEWSKEKLYFQKLLTKNKIFWTNHLKL